MISMKVSMHQGRHGSTIMSLERIFPEKNKAMYRRAFSRAAQSARKIAVRETIRQYYVPGELVRKSISILHGGNQGGANIVISGKRLSLDKFKFTPGRHGRRHTPLKAAVRKPGRVKPIPGAFLAPKKLNGGIFQREMESRLPIEKLYTLAVPQMIGHNPDTLDAMKEAAQETFSKVLKHEISRALGGAG